MNNRNIELIKNLKEASIIIREGGDVSSDYFHRAVDFEKAIEHLVSLIEQSDNSAWALCRSVLAKKRAKYTWCSPSFDLDDYLVGHPRAVELGCKIYELL
jgi:hypothetical protein